MKRRRYSDAEIARSLREVSAGTTTVIAAVRRLGVPRRTFYRWLARYGDSADATLARLRALEREATSARRQAARLARENHLLKELLGKPWRRLLPGGQPFAGP